MKQSLLEFHKVLFAYDSAASPLFHGLTVCFYNGWTGIVGANGAGKTTLLKLATGESAPQQGYVNIPGEAVYCPQRTDDAPPMLADFVDAVDGNACRIKGSLGITENWLERWETLSHGERKRAQIGVALWRRPLVLAVDEPTNHIDAAARELLCSALRSFKGIGLLVSHDRELLDTLCRQCLFVEPPGALLRPGGYSKGVQQTRMEAENERKQLEIAKHEQLKLKQLVSKHREEASRSHKKRSKRGLPIKDHDARYRKNIARCSGKDGVAGKLMRQLDGRLEQARRKRESMVIKKTYQLGIWLPGYRSKRDALVRLTAGSIPLGGGRWLHFPDLGIHPEDRIALTGVNGSGKSTLVRHIINSVDLPRDRVTYLPQEIDLGSSEEIMERARKLPKDKLGRMMTVVSRLGSVPQRLLESSQPSPGEIRKVLLAIGIANAPHFIIMDEPTNHLDLPSIECLEDALEGCPCSLLLVSHDLRFLQRLTTAEWHIEWIEGSAGENMQVKWRSKLS
ncbi:ATP-binding cassette domain-containing protein [Planctomycetota bacterium]